MRRHRRGYSSQIDRIRGGIAQRLHKLMIGVDVVNVNCSVPLRSVDILSV